MDEEYELVGHSIHVWTVEVRGGFQWRYTIDGKSYTESGDRPLKHEQTVFDEGRYAAEMDRASDGKVGTHSQPGIAVSAIALANSFCRNARQSSSPQRGDARAVRGHVSVPPINGNVD